MRVRSSLVVAFALLSVPSLASLAGCGHSLQLAAGAATTSANQVARVDLVEVDDQEYKLKVYNNSTGQMVIDRNAFVLQTPTTIIRREPGGISQSYEVAPGESHDVNLEFQNVPTMPPGQQVYLLVDPAVRINGQLLGLAPIVLQVK